MTHQENYNLSFSTIEEMTRNGLEAIPELVRVILSSEMQAERSNFFHINYLLTQETAIGINSSRVLYQPYEMGFMVYTDVMDYAFSPDNNKLFILYDVYSEYYEHSLRIQTYLWDLDKRLLYDFDCIEGVSGSLSPRLVWSPDSKQVFFFLTNITEAREYRISIYSTDLESGPVIYPYEEDILISNDYLYITNVYWP